MGLKNKGKGGRNINEASSDNEPSDLSNNLSNIAANLAAPDIMNNPNFYDDFIFSEIPEKTKEEGDNTRQAEKVSAIKDGAAKKAQKKEKNTPKKQQVATKAAPVSDSGAAMSNSKSEKAKENISIDQNKAVQQHDTEQDNFFDSFEDEVSSNDEERKIVIKKSAQPLLYTDNDSSAEVNANITTASTAAIVTNSITSMIDVDANKNSKSSANRAVTSGSININVDNHGSDDISIINKPNDAIPDPSTTKTNANKKKNVLTTSNSTTTEREYTQQDIEELKKQLKNLRKEKLDLQQSIKESNNEIRIQSSRLLQLNEIDAEALAISQREEIRSLVTQIGDSKKRIAALVNDSSSYKETKSSMTQQQYDPPPHQSGLKAKHLSVPPGSNASVNKVRSQHYNRKDQQQTGDSNFVDFATMNDIQINKILQNLNNSDFSRALMKLQEVQAEYGSNSVQSIFALAMAHYTTCLAEEKAKKKIGILERNKISTTKRHSADISAFDIQISQMQVILDAHRKESRETQERIEKLKIEIETHSPTTKKGFIPPASGKTQVRPMVKIAKQPQQLSAEGTADPIAEPSLKNEENTDNYIHDSNIKNTNHKATNIPTEVQIDEDTITSANYKTRYSSDTKEGRLTKTGIPDVESHIEVIKNAKDYTKAETHLPKHGIPKKLGSLRSSTTEEQEEKRNKSEEALSNDTTVQQAFDFEEENKIKIYNEIAQEEENTLENIQKAPGEEEETGNERNYEEENQARDEEEDFDVFDEDSENLEKDEEKKEDDFFDDTNIDTDFESKEKGFENEEFNTTNNINDNNNNDYNISNENKAENVPDSDIFD